jgi:hypothetical protein
MSVPRCASIRTLFFAWANFCGSPGRAIGPSPGRPHGTPPHQPSALRPPSRARSQGPPTCEWGRMLAPRSIVVAMRCRSRRAGVSTEPHLSSGRLWLLRHAAQTCPTDRTPSRAPWCAYLPVNRHSPPRNRSAHRYSAMMTGTRQGSRCHRSGQRCPRGLAPAHNAGAHASSSVRRYSEPCLDGPTDPREAFLDFGSLMSHNTLPSRIQVGIRHAPERSVRRPAHAPSAIDCSSQAHRRRPTSLTARDPSA